MQNSMIYGLVLGLLFGAMLTLAGIPNLSLNPPENCGIRKVLNEVQVAYVLKAPEPQTCVPEQVSIEPRPEEQVQSTPAAEPEPEKIQKRHHRYHYRHRRYRYYH